MILGLLLSHPIMVITIAIIHIRASLRMVDDDGILIDSKEIPTTNAEPTIYSTTHNTSFSDELTNQIEPPCLFINSSFIPLEIEIEVPNRVEYDMKTQIDEDEVNGKVDNVSNEIKVQQHEQRQATNDLPTLDELLVNGRNDAILLYNAIEHYLFGSATTTSTSDDNTVPSLTKVYAIAFSFAFYPVKAAIIYFLDQYFKFVRWLFSTVVSVSGLPQQHYANLRDITSELSAPYAVSFNLSFDAVQALTTLVLDRIIDHFASYKCLCDLSALQTYECAFTNTSYPTKDTVSFLINLCIRMTNHFLSGASAVCCQLQQHYCTASISVTTQTETLKDAIGDDVIKFTFGISSELFHLQQSSSAFVRVFQIVENLEIFLSSQISSLTPIALATTSGIQYCYNTLMVTLFDKVNLSSLNPLIEVTKQGANKTYCYLPKPFSVTTLIILFLVSLRINGIIPSVINQFLKNKKTEEDLDDVVRKESLPIDSATIHRNYFNSTHTGLFDDIFNLKSNLRTAQRQRIIEDDETSQTLEQAQEYEHTFVRIALSNSSYSCFFNNSSTTLVESINFDGPTVDLKDIFFKEFIPMICSSPIKKDISDHVSSAPSSFDITETPYDFSISRSIDKAESKDLESIIEPVQSLAEYYGRDPEVFSDTDEEDQGENKVELTIPVEVEFINNTDTLDKDADSETDLIFSSTVCDNSHKLFINDYNIKSSMDEEKSRETSRNSANYSDTGVGEEFGFEFGDDSSPEGLGDLFDFEISFDVPQSTTGNHAPKIHGPAPVVYSDSESEDENHLDLYTYFSRPKVAFAFLDNLVEFDNELAPNTIGRSTGQKSNIGEDLKSLLKFKTNPHEDAEMKGAEVQSRQSVSEIIKLDDENKWKTQLPELRETNRRLRDRQVHEYNVFHELNY